MAVRWLSERARIIIEPPDNNNNIDQGAARHDCMGREHGAAGCADCSYMASSYVLPDFHLTCVLFPSPSCSSNPFCIPSSALHRATVLPSLFPAESYTPSHKHLRFAIRLLSSYC